MTFGERSQTLKSRGFKETQAKVNYSITEACLDWGGGDVAIKIRILATIRKGGGYNFGSGSKKGGGVGEDWQCPIS